MFFPCILNTLDSLDHVPLLLIRVPYRHPLWFAMNEVALHSIAWEWPEPPGRDRVKWLPGF